MSPSRIVHINVKLEIRPSRWAALSAVALCCVGCSGFQAAPSISPATFLLPGLGQTLPAPSPASELDSLPSNPGAIAVHVAQAR
jgi:hypothetical protein